MTFVSAFGWADCALYPPSALNIRSALCCILRWGELGERKRGKQLRILVLRTLPGEGYFRDKWAYFSCLYRAVERVGYS